MTEDLERVTRAAIAARAGEYLQQGYHCSEAVVLAVAPTVVPDWHPACLRLANGFAGGLGGTQQEMCGALAGGIMVIGALFGRQELKDDALAQQLSARLREAFWASFGGSQCAWLRTNVVEPPGGLGSCSVLVPRATGVLLDVLAEAGVSL